MANKIRDNWNSTGAENKIEPAIHKENQFKNLAGFMTWYGIQLSWFKSGKELYTPTPKHLKRTEMVQLDENPEIEEEEEDDQ